MPINLSNPNLDFDLEQELIKAKFLRANELQDTNDETFRGYGGHTAPWHPGTGIGNALKRMSGRTRQRGAEQEFRDLSNEQMNRFQALQSQLTPPAPIDMSDPNAIMAENARLQNIGLDASRLPMARKFSEQILQSTSALPNALMKKIQDQGFQRGMQDDRHEEARKVAETKRNQELADYATMRADEQSDYDRNRKDTLADAQAKRAHELEKMKIKNSGVTEQAARGNANAVQFELGSLYEKILDYREGEYFNASTGLFGGLMTKMAGDLMAGITDQGTGAAKLETIRDNVKTFGKQIATMGDKGKLGNMAIKEWDYVERATAALNNPAEREDFAKNLERLKIHLQNFMDLSASDLEGVGADEYDLEEYARDLQTEVEERTAQGSTGRNRVKSDEPTVRKTATAPDGTVWELLSDGTERQVK